VGIGTNIFAGADVSTDGGGSSVPVETATYGPQGTSAAGPFSPRHGHGAGFWLAIAGVVILVAVRQSLPR